jgi:hypothetical protein
MLGAQLEARITVNWVGVDVPTVRAASTAVVGLAPAAGSGDPGPRVEVAAIRGADPQASSSATASTTSHAARLHRAAR